MHRWVQHCLWYASWRLKPFCCVASPSHNVRGMFCGCLWVVKSFYSLLWGNYVSQIVSQTWFECERSQYRVSGVNVSMSSMCINWQLRDAPASLLLFRQLPAQIWMAGVTELSSATSFGRVISELWCVVHKGGGHPGLAVSYSFWCPGSLVGHPYHFLPLYHVWPLCHVGEQAVAKRGLLPRWVEQLTRVESDEWLRVREEWAEGLGVAYKFGMQTQDGDLWSPSRGIYIV